MELDGVFAYKVHATAPRCSDFKRRFAAALADGVDGPEHGAACDDPALTQGAIAIPH